jgi:uncharacterized coiled-coil protein SlyX
MEELLQQLTGYFSISVNLLLLLGGTILILLFLNIVSFLKIGSLKKKYNKFMTGQDGKSLEETIVKQKEEIESLIVTVKDRDETISKIHTLLEQTYSKMGLVKYDALNNMSGKISFAFVLLNAENSGFLMNSIHTRNGSYVYLRDIKNGTCDVKLGDEETQALQMALNS